MNNRIIELFKQIGAIQYDEDGDEQTPILVGKDLEKFAELIIKECIGILETEIELVKGYKSTARNDFDIKWHQGKITHFTILIEKSKKHFGVEQ